MPYIPFYAFEEIPSIFGDDPFDLQSLTACLKELTKFITDGKVSAVPPLADDEARAADIRRLILSWSQRRSKVKRAYQEVKNQARTERAMAEEALKEASRQRRITTWAAVAAVAIASFVTAGYFSWFYVKQRREAERKQLATIADAVIKTAQSGNAFTASLLLRELQGQPVASGLLSTAQALSRAHLPALAWQDAIR